LGECRESIEVMNHVTAYNIKQNGDEYIVDGPIITELQTQKAECFYSLDELLLAPGIPCKIAVTIIKDYPNPKVIDSKVTKECIIGEGTKYVHILIPWDTNTIKEPGTYVIVLTNYDKLIRRYYFVVK
jgi:hypothetical protein